MTEGQLTAEDGLYERYVWIYDGLDGMMNLAYLAWHHY